MENVVSGHASNFVQASTVGEVHFHGFTMPKPAQLPGAITCLVNQKRVQRELDEALTAQQGDTEPVIRVLRGQRGSGKTTVAVHWLHRRADRFPDGQLYANLGAWTDQVSAPSEVLAGFLGALGVDRSQIPAGLEAREGLFRSLTRQRAFQVLLDDAVTPAQVRSLLPGRGGSMVVVTGHGAFGSLLQQNAKPVDVEPLEDEMAVELLRQFAGDRVDAEPDARDALVDMCAGLPAALCVVGLLLAESDAPVAELVEELAAGITQVSVGGERSLGAVFDAGYRRLSDVAQQCYRVIGLHPRGDDLSVAVVAAALDQPEPVVRQGIRELRDTRTIEQPRTGRLSVHKLVHEHARLVAEAVDDRRTEVQRRMLAWYEAGSVVADAKLMPQRPWSAQFFGESTVSHPAGADPGSWMRSERLNLRAAVALASDLGEPEVVLRLCVAHWWLYESEKNFDDLLATHELGLPAADHLQDDRVKSLLLSQKGFALRSQGRFDEATEVCTEAMELGEAVGSAELAATALESAGLAALDNGDTAAARKMLRHNLVLAESIGDPRRIALACLHNAKAEEPEVAVPMLDRALALFRSLPVAEPHNVAKAFAWQGRKLGDRAKLDEALAVMTELKRHFDRAEILEALAAVGDRDEALSCYRRALEIYEENGFLTAALATQRRLADLD